MHRGVLDHVRKAAKDDGLFGQLEFTEAENEKVDGMIEMRWARFSKETQADNFEFLLF